MKAANYGLTSYENHSLKIQDFIETGDAKLGAAVGTGGMHACSFRAGSIALVHGAVADDADYGLFIRRLSL